MSENSTFRVQGDLTFATAPSLLQQSMNWLGSGPGPLVLDLGKVDRTDSAGIALLLEWIELAKQRGIDLRILNVPRKTSEFIGVNGLSELFGEYAG